MPVSPKPATPFFHGEFVRRIFLTLSGILLVYVIFYVGTLIHNNLKTGQTIGFAPKSERYITIEADGKATVVPDVAVITMGMSSNAPTVNEAQTKNTAVMNSIIAKTKDLGVKAEDISTENYQLAPHYEYNEKNERQLKGYDINQSVQIKIRDLTKAPLILALAGEVGANSVSGIDFVVDNREAIVDKARAAAIKNVKAKASGLAKNLGLRFTEIYSYNEYEQSTSPLMAKAYGGEQDMAGLGPNPSVLPKVEPGKNEINLHVSITFVTKSGSSYRR